MALDRYRELRSEQRTAGHGAMSFSGSLSAGHESGSPRCPDPRSPQRFRQCPAITSSAGSPTNSHSGSHTCTTHVHRTRRRSPWAKACGRLCAQPRGVTGVLPREPTEPASLTLQCRPSAPSCAPGDCSSSAGFSQAGVAARWVLARCAHFRRCKLLWCLILPSCGGVCIPLP